MRNKVVAEIMDRIQLGHMDPDLASQFVIDGLRGTLLA